ncbi:TRAP transporter small permease [Paracoccus xiamenensis]|uniref:TRAP transporter small permease n=1 Tax=Paracoccus xiamenensis TaxID=2714901 RepID=UPI00140C15C9|nr:TRAP transporter small permease [Paracoccus xiamenensis]NHF72578.1 TRAP transporter small permease [Paracoccus xiamenensis]
MRALALALDRVSDALARIALWGAVLSIIVMVLSAGWQVLARYLLDTPPPWTEEVARFMMVWAGLLGAASAFRNHEDPSLFPEMREKTGLMGDCFLVIRNAAALIFTLPVLWFCLVGLNGQFGSGYIARTMARTADTMGVSMAVFSVAIPIGFALIGLFSIAELLLHFCVRRVTASRSHPAKPLDRLQ